MAYIGRQNLGGAYRQLDDISSGFDGSDTTHTMQVNSQNVTVGDVNQIILSLGGVIQKPGTDFTVSGSTLTFTTAPAANTNIFAILLGSDNGGTVTPTDGSVTTDKIAADQITKAKLADSVDIFAGTSLSAADLGSGVHIKTGDSGGSAHASADELIVETSGSGGIQILTANDQSGRLYFGDDGSTHSGFIEYSHANDRFEFGTSASTRVKIDSTGAMTNATQPAFLATVSTTQSNIADGHVQIEADNEIFDQNADYNTSNYTFTAPVTGRYSFQVNITTSDLAIDYQWVYCYIGTSNRTCFVSNVDPRIFDTAGAYSLGGAILVDMDANDTATLYFRSSAHGTNTVDIVSNTTNPETYFSGYLVC